MGATRSLSRRELLRSLGLVTAGTALAACRPATPQVARETVIVTQKETVVVEREKQHENVTISWWNQFSTETCQKVFPQVIEEFEQLYPWIKVDYEISGGPPGGGDYTEVLLSRIAAGNPPDTATLWSPPVQYAARGSLLAIDEYMAQAKWARPGTFVEAPLKSCQWRGKTYGLPASASNTVTLINKAKFEEKGLPTDREHFPKTWSDYKALAAQFVVYEKDELEEVGTVPWAGASWAFPLFSALNGGEVFDDAAEEYRLDSDNNVELLQFWVGWLDEQFRGDIEKLNAAGQWEGTYPESAFAQGRCFIVHEGYWAITDAPITVPFEVYHNPVGPHGTKSLTAWWPNWFVLPKGCPHPDDAFLLLEYFCTKGWILWYTKGAVDISPWTEFPKDTLNVVLVDMLGLERAKQINDFFFSYLDSCCVMWNSPIEDFAANTISSAIDEALHKVKTPKQVLQEAQQLCQEKLQQVLSGAG